jgi:hypothetical protein
MNSRDHLFNVAEVHTRGQMVALCVRVEELLVGLNNTDDLNIRTIQESAGWHERITTFHGKLDMTVN